MKSSDVRSIEKIKYKKDVLNIRWRVTTLCNYQCDFCIQGNREEHLRQAAGESSDLRNRICDAIVRLIESVDHEYRVIRMDLIGGEVTIIKEFPDILERLARSEFSGEIRFSITTNFSADAEYFRRMLDQFRAGAGKRKRTLFISASFYREYVTLEQFRGKLSELSKYAGSRPGVFQKVLGKLGLSEERWLSLSAGIPIVDDEDFGRLAYMKDECSGTGIRIIPIIIRNYDTNLSEGKLRTIIEKERKQMKVTCENGDTMLFSTIRELGAMLENTDSFCPTGYLCDAGIRNIWIDAFGNVKRCPALGSTMFMGSILDGSFQLFREPQMCTSDHCSCDVYGKIEKPGR
ncbi:MAG: radical SAM protein [Blautia sp.]|nr:radical SAM protein [Blautia sp.]